VLWLKTLNKNAISRNPGGYSPPNGERRHSIQLETPTTRAQLFS
jgi:hypothetical protein